MIVKDIHLLRADWDVRVYLAVSTYYADEILDDLITLGCRGQHLQDAKDNLWSRQLDTGLTYSNTQSRKTLIVVALASEGAEYWNSLDHEKNHLLQDIALTDDIDPFGEQISYISGEFIRDVFKIAKPLLCDCCRRKLRRAL